MANDEFSGGDSLTVTQLNRVTVGTTAPSSPVEGDVWVDTASSGDPVMKRYNGSSFEIWFPAFTGSTGQFLRVNSAGTGLEWAKVTVPVPGTLWGIMSGILYVADFNNPDIVAVLGAAGWQGSISLAGSTSTPATGDMNSQADDIDGASLMVYPTNGGSLISPRIIGVWQQLQVVEKMLGYAPTTITVGIWAAFSATTADATHGFGISNDEDAAITASGVIGIINGATNFEYRLDGAAGVSLGVTKDTTPHLWEFVLDIDAMTMDIKVDGTTRASGVTLIQDVWPKGIWAINPSSTVLPYLLKTSVEYA